MYVCHLYPVDSDQLFLDLVLAVVSSQIILMIADDMACNPRNPRPGNLRSHHAVAVYIIVMDYTLNDVIIICLVLKLVHNCN